MDYARTCSKCRCYVFGSRSGQPPPLDRATCSVFHSLNAPARVRLPVAPEFALSARHRRVLPRGNRSLVLLFSTLRRDRRDSLCLTTTDEPMQPVGAPPHESRRRVHASASRTLPRCQLCPGPLAPAEKSPAPGRLDRYSVGEPFPNRDPRTRLPAAAAG